MPDELMCVEWLRANPQPIPSSPSVSPVAPARGLFELQVQEQQPKTSPPFSPSARIDGERMPLTAIPADDLAALKSAGVEVQLHVGGGAIHLVPEYTRRSRIELTFEHAATLRRLLDAFPGARIAELGRIPRSAKETVMNVQPAKEVH